MVDSLFVLSLRSLLRHKSAFDTPLIHSVPQEVSDRILQEIKTYKLLDDNSLEALTYLPHLTVLNLRGMLHLSPSAILNSANKWKDLTEIRLNGYDRTTNEILVAFSRSPSRNTLKVLDVSGSLLLSNEGFEAMETLPSLRELILASNKHVSAAEVVAILHDKCPSLVVLVMNNIWTLRDQFLENLCKSPPDNPDQQMLPNLTSLSVINARITAGGIRSFLDNRKNIAEFTKLSFINPYWAFAWTDAFVEVGSEVLRRCPMLEWLDSWRIPNILPIIKQGGHSQLVRLKLEQPSSVLEHLPEILKRNSSLQVLGLDLARESNIEDLPVPPTLRTLFCNSGSLLSLPRTLVSDECCRLSALHFHHVTISTHCWTQITEQLPFLEKLMLHYTVLSISIQQFNDSISKLSRLTKLQMANLQHTQGEVKEVYSFILPNLRLLALHPSNDVQVISAHLPNLRKLECSKVKWAPYGLQQDIILSDREYMIGAICQGSTLLHRLDIYEIVFERPPTMSLLPKTITTLEISVPIEDGILKGIAQLSRLTSLSLMESPIGNEALKEILAGCSRLSKLSLDNPTQLSSISECESGSLSDLALASCTLSHVLTFSGFPGLCSIWVHECSVSIKITGLLLLADLFVSAPENVDPPIKVEVKETPMLCAVDISANQGQVSIESRNLEFLNLHLADLGSAELDCPKARYLSLKDTDLAQAKEVMTRLPALTEVLFINLQGASKEWALGIAERFPSLTLITLMDYATDSELAIYPKLPEEKRCQGRWNVP